jgi:hypothetical protein
MKGGEAVVGLVRIDGASVCNGRGLVHLYSELVIKKGENNTYRFCFSDNK